jgi:XRE family aerobic/anaerobic benzoate catabolism transcriptional regulator
MTDRTPLQAHPGGALVLGALARRVRRRRESLGWTQAQLAARAGLSVRFLARVESGDGNISVIRLHELAHALGVEAPELLRPVAPDRRLIALVGMRGAGKSTVGPALARALDAPFVEMDDLILEASGLTLDQIFELHGERYYRRLERETFERLLAAGEPAVVAAAGGVVNESATWKMMLREATVVWLRALPEDHWNRVIAQGDRRPMADHPDAMAELRAMLAAREPVYRQAHITVDTHGVRPETLATTIERRIADAAADGG